jgi:hypothetical protein
MPSLGSVVRLVVGVVLLVAGCSSRSTRKEASSGGTSGSAGTGSGGKATAGGATANGGASGATAGSSAIAGAQQGGTGGTSGTTGGASPNGGASPIGGASPTGGAGAGVSGSGGDGAGTSGNGGEGGGSGCEGPAPGGCPAERCPEGQECQLTSGVCTPSYCECTDGQWSCTEDCGGGVCVDAVACEGPDPSGCSTDDDCRGGKVCTPPVPPQCIPIRCACPITGIWECEDNCREGAGICLLPTCPAACQPRSGGGCLDEQVSWVCEGSPAPYEEFIDGGCMDTGSQVLRFCCPTSFKPECL